MGVDVVWINMQRVPVISRDENRIPRPDFTTGIEATPQSEM
jgi:hypothetical protein